MIRASIVDAARSSITVPTSVSSSIGSPARRAAAPSVTRSASESAISLTAMIRLTAVQRCPELANAPAHREPRGLVEVGVAENDQRIVSAELEHGAPVPEPRRD